VKDYAYPYIAKKYMLQSKFPLILGLTASPGGSYGRIDEICKNLFIKAVEVRSETDSDVEKYVKTVQKEFVYIEFPEEFQKIKIILEEVVKEDTEWLREHHYIPISNPPKKMLLELQRKVVERYIRGTKNFSVFWAMVKTISAIKISHAVELLETQGVSFLYDYLKRMEVSKKKIDKRVIKDPRIREVVKLSEELHIKKFEHPKVEKLVNIVKDLLREKSNSKIIIFANYRATVDKIKSILLSNGVSTEILIGQATKEGKGLTQQEQIETLKRFSDGEFNVLCTTSIGEEGLDIAATDVAIFYEAVPSEIRTIQRRGRVGRQTFGRVIFLITKGTRDEAYYWAAFRKEKKMKGILYDMKEKGVKEKRTLIDWTK
jgi:Fanconi anemia group M protein